MYIAIIDSNPGSRAALLGRVQEAMRQADVRRVEIVEMEPEQITAHEGSSIIGCLIGPGCTSIVSEVVEQARISFPTAMLGAVLENEIYAVEGVGLRKKVNALVMPMGDLAQIASFAIDCSERAAGSGVGGNNRGVIGVTQFKGGVGVTTLVAGLASCWARHGLSVVAIDFDDVNPQLTEWGRVGVAQRTVTGEFLRIGEVPQSRMNEILNPVEGYEGRLVVVGQPERYNEGFHFKADVLEGAPSASEFVTSLINMLRPEFDAVIIDLGRGWGVSTFAALPLCQQVLLVTDDDGMSVRRTLDGLQRLKRETDDPDELDLSRWSLALNAYTGRLLSPRDLASEIKEMDLFPAESTLFTVPFSETGRQWGGPGQSFYDLAEQSAKDALRRVAYSLVPFRFESNSGDSMPAKLIRKWASFVNPK